MGAGFDFGCGNVLGLGRGGVCPTWRMCYMSQTDCFKTVKFLLCEFTSMNYLKKQKQKAPQWARLDSERPVGAASVKGEGMWAEVGAREELKVCRGSSDGWRLRNGGVSRRGKDRDAPASGGWMGGETPLGLEQQGPQKLLEEEREAVCVLGLWC